MSLSMKDSWNPSHGVDSVPISVAGDRLYGVHSDAFGVERVVGFEVEEG